MGTHRFVAKLTTILLLAGCATGQADVPPAGEVWFGSSFDTDTFEIQDRFTTVDAHQSFSMVAHFPEQVDAAEFSIRVYWKGELVNTTPSNASGSGDLWGYSPGPLIERGVWRYEFIDIGGNILASGEITAT